MAAGKMRPFHKKTGIWWKKPLLWVLLPIVLIGCVALLWQYDVSKGEKGRAVEIQLTDEAGQPLGDTPAVGLIDTGREPIGDWGKKGVSTDREGLVRFEDVSPGAYWLRVGGTSLPIDVPANAPAVVRRERVADANNPDLYTVEWAVTGMDGQPAENVPVLARPWALETDAHMETVDLGRTDWRGIARWQGVPAGGHAVRVGNTWYSVVIEPSDQKTLRIGLSWAPSGAEETYRRTVRFLTGSGKPVADTAVQEVLYGVPTGKEFVLIDAKTDRSGNIVLEDCLPGKHTLRIQGRRFSFDIPYDGADADGVVVFRY